MKKIISLVLCLLMGGLVLVGCSNSSEPFEEKSYTPDTQINEINLDVRDREIEVSLSEDDQIHIQYSQNSKEYYDISENRKISLQVPDNLLQNLSLSTTNEDISLPELAVTGSISISSNGGNITFERLAVGSDLTLNVKNGNISGAIAGSYDDFAIQSEIKKGESNLPDHKEGGEKTLKVSGNNGDVDIAFANE